MTGSEAAGLITENLDYRMSILLSLRGFRIKQIDEYHASMDLLTGYTLQIDVRENQGGRIIAKETAEEYVEVSFSEFKDPKTVRDNALVLMDAYKGALIDYSIKAEERTLEEPVAGNLPRTRNIGKGKGPRIQSLEETEKEVQEARDAAKAKTHAEYQASTGAGVATDPREGPGLSAEKGNSQAVTTEENPSITAVTAEEVKDPEPPGKTQARPRQDPGKFPTGKEEEVIDLLARLLHPGPEDRVIKTEFKKLSIPT
jgi:hypothetical protein